MAIRGKIGQTKVKRYWPGKAPEWWEDDDEEDIWREAVLEKAFHSQGVGGSDIAKKDDDARLHRLAEYRVDSREEIRADHRCIRHVEIVSTIEEEERIEFEEEDEDALEERRRRIREKNLLRLQEEEEDEEEAEEAEAVEEEEESVYETESEGETTTSGIEMVKPAVFVPKSERDTIYEREKREAEERVLEELFRKRLEERKLETKQIMVEKIRDEEIIHKKLGLEANIAADVDTDDEVNEAEEYEAWKSRERTRIKRKKEEDAIFKTVQKEIEMLRNMTEEERKEWERRNPKPSPPPPKKKKTKRKFMQKYYHKGAFFQSDPDDRARAGTSGIDSICLRDFSAPTGEDKLDKSILPKIMQVKHFGRSGRTKWTHLVNEDTTDWNNPPIYNDTLVRAKYNARMVCC